MGIISTNSATNHHFSNRAKNCSFALSLPLLASLALSTTALLFSNNFAYAEASTSSSANASVTVSDTIRLTLTGGDLVINNLTPGTSADSNIITATVTSNSPYGFHLSATTGTKNGTTSLVNTADSNFSFTNLNANKASLNDFSDNTWGYSYSTNNGTSWVSGDYGATQTGYNGLSLDNDDSGATGTTLFNSDSYTNSTAVKFKIGAKSSSTQASGTYTGTVNFYAVTNPKPIMTIATATTMQEVDSKTVGGCPDTLTTNQAYELTDSRDGTVYHVARLADGNCWLLDNLALDLTNDTILNSLSADNTNIDTTNDPGALAALKGTTVRDPNNDSDGKYATAKVANWTSTNSNSAPLVNISNKDRTAPDETSNDPMQSQAISGGWKYGGYYNYCAASAGSYCYGNGIPEGTSSGNATSDICPKGWRMPTDDTSGEYSALANAIYGSTDTTYDSTDYANYRTALRLPLSGRFYYGYASNHGLNGYFWSSTRYSDSRMYILMLGISYVSPAVSYDRYNGLSVRCVLGS